MSGSIEIQQRPGNGSTAALLRDGLPCVALLAPESMYRAHRNWQGKRMTVRGTALARSPTAPDVVSLKYRDRWLQTSFCGESDIVLYVDKATPLH